MNHPTGAARNLYNLGETYLNWLIVPVDLGNGTFGFRALVPEGDIACNTVSSAYPTVQRAITAGKAFIMRWQQCSYESLEAS
jgi:hypothetical protein